MNLQTIANHHLRAGTLVRGGGVEHLPDGTRVRNIDAVDTRSPAEWLLLRMHQAKGSSHDVDLGSAGYYEDTLKTHLRQSGVLSAAERAYLAGGS